MTQETGKNLGVRAKFAAKNQPARLMGCRGLLGLSDAFYDRSALESELPELLGGSDSSWPWFWTFSCPDEAFDFRPRRTHDPDRC